MTTRKAKATWTGNLTNGEGKMETDSGICYGEYSAKSRFENGSGTNPEELIGSAHAGCFSMALSKLLADNGYDPEFIQTTANVNLEKKGDGFEITSIDLHNQSSVEKLDEKEFLQYADKAKVNCPVSKALAGTDINLKAELITGEGLPPTS